MHETLKTRDWIELKVGSIGLESPPPQLTLRERNQAEATAMTAKIVQRGQLFTFYSTMSKLAVTLTVRPVSIENLLMTGKVTGSPLLGSFVAAPLPSTS